MTSIENLDKAIEEIRQSIREAQSRNWPDEVDIHERQLQHFLKLRKEALSEQTSSGET